MLCLVGVLPMKTPRRESSMAVSDTRLFPGADMVNQEGQQAYCRVLIRGFAEARDRRNMDAELD
jgi:hypothetical protein